MVNLSPVMSSRACAPARPRAAGEWLYREWLYKDDYPRGIDRYIDFFGTGVPHAQVVADRCVDVFLESPA